MIEILIATGNPGKVKEIEQLVAPFPIKVRSLSGYSIPEPEETGSTFEANAILKASYYARETGLWALADDSGLEIEALGGAPGVLSARYAGADTPYPEKIAKLLGELEKTSDGGRLAKFVSVICIADERGNIKNLAEGVCNGKIALSPKGSNGFGYDPIFVPDGFSETFGELSDRIKQQISHRAIAFQKISEFFQIFPDFTSR